MKYNESGAGAWSSMPLSETIAQVISLAALSCLAGHRWPHAHLEPREPQVQTNALPHSAFHLLGFGDEQRALAPLPSATICSLARPGCGTLSQDGRAGGSLAERPRLEMDFSSCDIWASACPPSWTLCQPLVWLCWMTRACLRIWSEVSSCYLPLWGLPEQSTWLD